MNERRNRHKSVQNPLKNLDTQAYRRAFGKPDAEFHDRIRDTLFLIEEKEDAPVKKKMTFSMAFALVMCICIATAAFAGSSMLNNNQPDNTLQPLSQAQNTPSDAPMPDETLIPASPTPTPTLADYYRSGDMGFYHKLPKCFAGEQHIPTTEYDINRLYLTACPYCVFDTVYVMEDSSLYHKTADCTAFGEHSLLEVAFEKALSAGKYACPSCINSNCIFYPEGDKHTAYHLRICAALEAITDHSAAVQGTVAEARACGRVLCATCESSAVLYSPNDPYMFHISEECLKNGMDEAFEQIPLASALRSDITGCGSCISDLYYCTSLNGLYHTDYGCSGLIIDELMLLSEEEVISSGRTPCPDCILNATMVQPTPTPLPVEISILPTIPDKATATPMPSTLPVSSDTVTVYVDDGGIYYHTNPTCSDMTNPKKWQSYPLAQALNLGRTACPSCMHFSAVTSMPTSTPIASEPRTVYFVENGGIHYHTDSTCSGMKDPQLGSVAQALNLGKTACPSCMNVSPTPVPMNDSQIVNMTDYNGIYYHLDGNCMNMVGAYYTTFESMRNGDNRPPCPICIGTQQEDTYYYRTGGVFYHVDTGCSTLENCEVLTGTLTQVKALDRTPCPNCYEPSSTDITYYAAPAAYSYHTQFSCAAYASSLVGYPLPSNKSESAITFTDIFDPSGRYYSHYLKACPDCVLSEPVAASDANQLTDPLVPLMRNEAMEAPEGAPRAITINALDFDRDSVGTCSDLAVNFSCDVLSVHSTIMMHSRGAVYTEFEFTLHDAAVDPDSIRIIPYCEESGSLGCLWASVQEITYDDGETGYLLCQMMNSPSVEYNADRMILYSGDQMIAEFQ